MKHTSFILVMILLPVLITAQNFKLLRFDEDYSYLNDRTRDFYEAFKFAPLSSTGNSFVSMGGEIRQEYNIAQNEDWGRSAIKQNSFVLQRYNVHADLHLDESVRIFAQLRSGLEDGRKNGPRPIDEDRLNLQNLFIDVTPYRSLRHSMTIRFGRQELHYGSGRIIDVRDGPTLRFYFDGIKIIYNSPKLRSDIFVMAAPIVRKGIFDNNSSKRADLWGIYNTYSSSDQYHVEMYYVGIDRESSRFDDGVAPERRHTIGTRVWADRNSWIYNFEFAYQFGKFGKSKICAYAISSDIGYRFRKIKGFPTARLRADYISGDGSKDDHKMGTLNAIYPNGGYFGMNPQVGPANLLSVHPKLSWNVSKKALVIFEMLFSWRNSLNDGVYGPAGTLILSSSNSIKRYIGTAYITTFSLNVSRFINYNIGVQYFNTGQFLNDVIDNAKNGFFMGTSIGFKF